MIQLAKDKYINLKLSSSDNKESICIVGLTLGFFGTVEKRNFVLEETNTDIINNNLIWLLNECVKDSSIMIIGDTHTVTYYNAIFKWIGTSLKKKIKWQSVNVDKCIKFIQRYHKYVDNPSQAYVNIIEDLNSKKMKFTKFIMNPPYMQGLGGKIVVAAHKLYKDAEFSVLMPISNYKADDLYSYISEIDIADPGLFEDADITKGLCICKLSNTTNPYSFLEMEMKTYDHNFINFYQTNYKLPQKYIFERLDYATVDDFDFDKDYVDTNRLVNWDVGFMNGGTGQGYIWNVSRRKEIKAAGLVVIHFNKPKERENFTTWAYSDVKNGLANKVLLGLNKATTSSLCYIAIPQIDWEKISETDLWKKKDYDGAVLKEMGLKWTQDKKSVELV